MEWTVDSGHWRVHFNFFAFYVMESYFGLFGKFPFDRAFRWPSSSSLLVVVISHAMAILRYMASVHDTWRAGLTWAKATAVNEIDVIKYTQF